MKNKRWIFPLACILALLIAVPVFSVYYDGTFTNLLVKGELKMAGSTYDKIKYVTGNTTLTPYMGNAVYATLSTNSTLTLPVITSELDGYAITVKLESGATTFTVAPASADTIESTRGTTNAASDTTIDAVGDVRKWRARYDSAGNSYWAYEAKDIT